MWFYVMIKCCARIIQKYNDILYFQFTWTSRGCLITCSHNRLSRWTAATARKRSRQTIRNGESKNVPTIRNGSVYDKCMYSAPPLFATPLICHPHLSPTICQSPIRHHVISPFNLPPAPSHLANQSHAQTVDFAIEIPRYFTNLPLCANFSVLDANICEHIERVYCTLDNFSWRISPERIYLARLLQPGEILLENFWIKT